MATVSALFSKLSRHLSVPDNRAFIALRSGSRHPLNTGATIPRQSTLPEEVPVYRTALVLSVLFLLTLPVLTQQSSSNSAAQKPGSYAAIPVEASKAQNPVKPSAESTARAKKWWTVDCEMCHGKNGDGKGETAKDMKLTMMDFTNPDTLKDRTDGDIFYIIKNGHNDMPAEGPRVKTEEAWDLVNYVRAFGKKKDADTKTQ
jgi:mono/diheme cytochrome c family protein